MEEALALHAAGRLPDTEKACLKIIGAEPRHREALNLLGTICMAQGRAADAAQHFGEVVALDPNHMAARMNKAASLAALGRHADAIADLDAVLAAAPGHVDALTRRAKLLRILNRVREASEDLRHALALDPEHAGALSGIGQLLEHQGQLAEAIVMFDRAIAVQPESFDARIDRANVLFKLGKLPESMAEWDGILTEDPDNVVGHTGRGNVLFAQGCGEAALAEYDLAVELAPDFAVAPFNRGRVLESLHRPGEAIAAYQWAIGIKPDFSQAMFNCAVLLGDCNRHDESLAMFEQLLVVDPNFPHALGNVALERSVMCRWDDRDEIVRRVVDEVSGGRAIMPFTFIALSPSAAAQKACAEMVIAKFHPPAIQPLWNGEIYQHERIRVAYVSADFHEHAVAFLAAGLIEQHDRNRFELTGVVFGPDHASSMRDRIEASFEHVIDIRKKTDVEVARLLRVHEIDIAVDLMGFTSRTRTGIFALRPAPVQVNYLGYPGTMGAPYIDYIFGDPFLIPEQSRAHCTESVVYMPDTFQVNDAKRRVAEQTPTRATLGLPERGFVFCCLSNSFKINPQMFSIWMRLLSGVPDSVLWLFAGNQWVETNLRREAEQRGVAPTRLVFAKRLPGEAYLAQYRYADLFLDTLPFNGGATVSDALWMGVPVVTCPGEAFASRMAGSLLHAIGLPELVTHSLPDYEALALQLATDKPRLAELRLRLARNRVTHPLFDTDLFRRHIEAAYVTMWEKTQRGEAPATFAVERGS